MATFRLHLPVFCGFLAAFTTGCASGSGMARGTDNLAVPRSEPGSIVTSDDFDRSPTQSIETTVQSRVPGVMLVRTADGGLSIRLRGTSTIMGNAEPLYVIDGLPVQPGSNGSLVGITAYDIASIQVLRDAASLSFYGVRGANGVILIKTKHAQ